MRCSKCNSENYCKNGKARNKQRYLCLECGYNYTVEKKSTTKDLTMKRNALELYLEGLGFRSIGRILNVSHVAVYYWIKQFGEKITKLRNPENIKIVEMDEMHTYISKKNYCWIWIAVDRIRKKFIASVFGTRGTKTGQQLCDKIKNIAIDKVATDYWKPYTEFILPKKHQTLVW